MVKILGRQGDGPIKRGMTLPSTNEIAGLVVFNGGFLGNAQKGNYDRFVGGR